VIAGIARDRRDRETKLEKGYVPIVFVVGGEGLEPAY
jgi:hypothetical protein